MDALIAALEGHPVRRIGRVIEGDALKLLTLGGASSIRIPIATVDSGWKGWLEDRRPSSNADPYKVASVIVETVSAATKAVKG